MNLNKDYLFGLREINMMKLSQMKPKGITIHNTANVASARNEAANVYNNNTKRGKNGSAVHLFIDEKDTYLVVPFEIHGWHSSDGNGFGNRSTISIEICHSLDYSTTKYERSESRAAVLTAQLMKEFDIPLSMVKRHYDYSPGKKRCPHRMFEGKPNTWEQYLAMVKEAGKGVGKPILPSTPNDTLTIDEVAEKVIRGDYGNGDARRANIEKAGYNYSAVQDLVNKKLGAPASKPKPKPVPVKKSDKEVALEIYKGVGGWGNGQARKDKLEKAGYNPSTVQGLVNDMFGQSKPKPKKTASQVANEIYRGTGGWGNNPGRKQKLEAAGYNYSEVQKIVNNLLK